MNQSIVPGGTAESIQTFKQLTQGEKEQAPGKEKAQPKRTK